MHQEMVQLGESIKDLRQQRGFTLKEVENGTSIRLSYLQAIEEGQLGKLISPIYARGFITKYAAFLEVDPDGLLEKYPYVRQILNEQYSGVEEFTLGIGSLEVRGSPGTEVKWLPNLLWVSLSVGAILISWLAARYFGLI